VEVLRFELLDEATLDRSLSFTPPPRKLHVVASVIPDPTRVPPYRVTAVDPEVKRHVTSLLERLSKQGVKLPRTHTVEQAPGRPSVSVHYPGRPVAGEDPEFLQGVYNYRQWREPQNRLKGLVLDPFLEVLPASVLK